MLLKLLAFLFHAVIEDKGAKCPRCGGTNTDKENGIWYCYDCKKEFGRPG